MVVRTPNSRGRTTVGAPPPPSSEMKRSSVVSLDSDSMKIVEPSASRQQPTLNISSGSSKTSASSAWGVPSTCFQTR